MKLAVLVGTILLSSTASADTKIEYPSGVGKPYLVYSIDPFDGIKSYKYMVASTYLYVRCGKIELRGRDGYFDEFSFPAEMKFRVDGMDYSFNAKYKTVGISNSRYFSLMSSADPIKYDKLIEALKNGSKAIVGGKWHTDWEHRTIDLAGFTKAYKILDCG